MQWFTKFPIQARNETSVDRHYKFRSPHRWHTLHIISFVSHYFYYFRYYHEQSCTTMNLLDLFLLPRFPWGRRPVYPTLPS